MLGGGVALAGLLLGYAGVIDDGAPSGELPAVPVPGLRRLA
jgi:hypothetical protein